MKTNCPKCKRELGTAVLNSGRIAYCPCGHSFVYYAIIELEPDADNIGSNVNKIKLTKEKTLFRLEELELKCEIPFPEWFMIMRDCKTLKHFTYIDAKNQCVAMFKPYISNSLFDVAIEIAPINIGKRFEQMNSFV